MKNLYTTLVLVFMTATSIAQDYAMNINKVEVKDNQIVAIEDNQIVSIKEVINTSKDDTDFRYYYFPNMYAYYDLENNNYIYKVNNQWKTSSELPQYYGGYSLFKNTRIPIQNYKGDTPQEKLKEHKKKFPYIKKSRMLKSLKIDESKAISSINQI